MGVRIIVCFALIAIFTVPTTVAKADEPTWLFTVPKARTLEEGVYNIGFLYADFGVTDNLELGIHGLKYYAAGPNLAFGLSIFPMASPYVVTSFSAGSGELHLGLKAAPYVFFAGFETPISDSVKFVAEFNNGFAGGVRIFPAEKWTLDIFVAFINFDVYRYKYRADFDEFRSLPGILFAYSDRF